MKEIAAFPANTIHADIERMAATHPQAIAVTCGTARLTYEELNTRANKLAHHLIAQGVKPDSIVAISMERSLDMIVGLLGILKAGGAYLPLDPAYPADRIAYMLEDARPVLLITQHTLRPGLPTFTGPVIDIDNDWTAMARQERSNPVVKGLTPGNLAYIIYTSGSTGRPKGVMIEHRNVSRLFAACQDWFHFGTGDVWTLFHSFAFDFSVWEIWGALRHGGRLVIVPRETTRAPREFYRLLCDEGVTVLNQTPSAFRQLIHAQAELLADQGDEAALQHKLRFIIFGGEALEMHSLKPWLEHNPIGAPKLINMYGITETTVHVTYRELTAGDIGEGKGSNIGVPIPDLGVVLLDEHLKPVPVGEIGEIHVSGAGLARGYLGRPELTAERFIADPYSDKAGERLYRSGDLARKHADGTLEYLGRNDHQVKIRGFRIELGEIEAEIMRDATVQEAVVLAREDRPGNKRLVAYLTLKKGQAFGQDAMRRHLGQKLPEYMVPSAFVVLEAFPLTVNGKLDRAALPAAGGERPDLSTAFAAATTRTEKLLAASWADVLGIDRVGIDDNFFDLGGNSFLSVQATSALEEQGLYLPIVKLYQHPTVRACAAFLDGSGGVAPSEMAARRKALVHGKGDVAIIGMSGRFPGAASVEELWRNLLAKKNGISRWSVDELDPSIPAALRDDPDYVKARGVIADADKFDHGFFGVNPRLADLMDPQQRVFLETAWAALEDAAYDPSAFDGLIGVYAGMYNNTYYTHNVIGHPELIEQVGDFQVMTGNEKDFIATRLAFEFDLRGPALSIHTACSTSLVAIAQAFKALREGECDMALAGGVAITSPINSGTLYNEGGMLSPDGNTRTFDAHGKGTSFSDGTAVVVLKRLDDAVRDKDHIYAVVKGAALNNDGSEKASFTAPSVRGQAEVIAMAQADAGITPDQVGYIEAHGTATPLGDPIEVEGLKQAFGSAAGGNTKPWCALGSVKSNIGHLTAAAGAAGVIKTALALQREQIPASIGFEKPNPAIDFVDSPFHVAQDNLAWPRTDKPRIAGVSSFGVGGTNAHVILAEPPVATPSGPSRGKQLFLLSAKSRASLDAMTDNLRKWLEEHPDSSLADAAFTLQTGRRHFRHRRLIVGGTHGEVIEAIANKDTNLTGTRELHEASPGVVFMFPGQGSQYVNMGRDLRESEPVFRTHFDQCCTLFTKELGTDLRTVIFPGPGEEGKAAEQLKRTVFTQPALFTMHYSLAKLWMHWGIMPDAMIGHSIGEFAAACLAGIFSLEDAVKLVAHRGRMMQDLPEGSMLSVRAPEEEVARRLSPACSIAANNGPRLCVASGPHEDIAKLQAALEKDGITCKLLVTSHAFHSPMMEPMVEPFGKVVESVQLHTPRIPIVSTVTAQWLKDEEACSPSYWSNHVRATVRFAQAVKFAWTDTGETGAKAWAGSRVMLEVGPRATATTLARQQSSDSKKHVAVSSLGSDAGNGEELTHLLKAVGGLWQSGVNIHWKAFHELEDRKRLSMPTYAFERVRHWVDPVAVVATNGHVGREVPSITPIPQAAVDAGLSPKDQLIIQIKTLLEDSSGLELAEASNEETFLEMGLDSLFLTQVATSLSRKFGVKVSFRQLNEELANLDKLADHILPHWGGKAAPAQANGEQAQPGSPALNAFEDAPDLKKTFGAQARIVKEKTDDFTPQQRAWFDDFVERYTTKTAKSKAFTQQHRARMADPRVVTGFKPLTKEVTYQVVVDRSQGCHLWDIDGNEYVDILSGFGSSLFGYMPDFVKKAIHEQTELSNEIGPMTPLAAEVCDLLCEFTGHDRAAVCNTGSEAVMGAMRMARTVTGRSLIISFTGSYHGIHDEVIIRGSKSHKSYPGAAGIMPESVQNMLVLDYGTPESLEIIRQRCHETAAVLVEPVQSRRMEFRPVDFLREVRRITREHGTALIFDEVITGFRMHPGGTQALFGIKADIASYGKVIGGGMHIGAMAGARKWMDALDGGWWQFGDDSVPEVGLTYFAGTFVRQPLSMAATKAALLHLKQAGPSLQERLNTMTEKMVARGNELFEKYQLPFHWVNFGSAFKTKYDESVHYTEFFFMLMRLHGVHLLDFPHFLTTAHTEADVEFILDALEKTCQELRASGFMPERTYPIPVVNSVLGGSQRRMSERVISALDAPVPGARLGRTPKGDPAWFVPDPDRKGKYLMVELEEK